MRIILTAIILLAVSSPAYAEDALDKTRAPVPETRIETDAKTGEIRFIVNGKEAARIDAKGLHVRENVNYGGVLTDQGADAYDAAGEKTAR